MLKKLSFFLTTIILFLTASFSVNAQENNRMNFILSKDGKVTVTFLGKRYVENSPLALIVKDRQIFEPQSTEEKGSEIIVKFTSSSKAILEKQERYDGSVRLSVKYISKDVDGFIFGPYVSPNAVEAGEFIGAAWQKDGSAVCIQSLNPKTQGECIVTKEDKESNLLFAEGRYSKLSFTNSPDFPIPTTRSAGLSDGKYVLSCKVVNMTKPYRINTFTGLQNVPVNPVPAPEGNIEGAAIILTCAENSDDLLEKIGKIEIEEGLPHPTINGEWAKTSSHTNDIYFVFGSSDIDSQIKIAEAAGVKWIYFSDPFQSWGHFDINTKKYPGGKEQFKSTIEQAQKHGINIGFHTLSNFIHTHDKYVTPIPDKGLLTYDRSKLTEDISEEDTDLFIAEALNFDMQQTLSAIRIGDELIKYDCFDKESLCLKSCTRGAFGTKAAAHKKGSTVFHMADYGYGTLFPALDLQKELADNIGNLIKESNIYRMSFDGVEGCSFLGYGTYGESVFVQRIFDITGNSLICDASIASHYRWHAHSYFNWGEPWYDYKRTGGMYNYRATNLDLFKRNLLPCMLGWYEVFNNSGRAEATLPETMEFMISRTIAFDAGLCFTINIPKNDKLDNYLGMIKLWQQFKHEADIPQGIRDKMKDERSNWHLEKKGDKWILSELTIKDYDMTYCDNSVITESGTTGYISTEESLKQSSHRSNIVIDRSSPDKNIPFITEPFHCRIRVGTPLDQGKMHNVSFSKGWFGKRLLSFKITANSGEYLEYNGGKTLYRYDKNYNLIEKVEGSGEELIVNGENLCGFTVDYDIVDENPKSQPIVPILEYIRTKQIFEL